MLCDVCGERDAVVKVTQVGEQGKTLVQMCERCAAERNIETTVSLSKNPLGEFLSDLQKQASPSSADTARCTFCNATLRDFRATGRLGCARCYTTFEPSLRDLLRRVHGSSKHLGRRYESPEIAMTEEQTELHELRERLRRAIEAEQFELAAELRDRIKVMGEV
jgi:protein arginine kinase activator